MDVEVMQLDADISEFIEFFVGMCSEAAYAGHASDSEVQSLKVALEVSKSIFITQKMINDVVKRFEGKEDG